MTDNQQNTAGLAAMEAPLSPPRSDSPVDSNSVDSNSLSTAPLSIRQLALLHPRERLLVPPTNWTPRHLEVLRCSFSEPAPAPATALAGKPQGGDYLRHEMERWVWRSPSGRSDTVRDLIGGAFTSQRNIGFYFHQRQVQILTCDLLFCKVDESFDQTLKDNPDALPPIVAAYVDLHQIDSARMEHFGVFKISRYRPMRRRLLCLNKLKKAKSTNHLHDPYIAALLIAIAQDDMHFARDLSAISSWTVR
ncbi:hypothetical protein OCS_05775 [Ophiocordyceps sinensis CO18]|uniref:Uncharacterized protein n=1 Tax=Ophiocordyceps sinensis (strain Co18 / CGMCC 3.14243) TaxID=911162 RepID=T5A9M3_OPHSC|nr:hypothetical protein OCS_05775 [Ophiocordyceps sinensis CO18]